MTELMQKLQAARDSLCDANTQTRARDLSRAAGYGAGVEAMWEAAEDAVKARDPETVAALADQLLCGECKVLLKNNGLRVTDAAGRIDLHGPTDDEAT